MFFEEWLEIVSASDIFFFFLFNLSVSFWKLVKVQELKEKKKLRAIKIECQNKLTISQDGFMKQSCQFCCHGSSEQRKFLIFCLIIHTGIANFFLTFQKPSLELWHLSYSSPPLIT